MTIRRFELKEEHIRLLTRACVSYDNYCEFGAPRIDPKRPYGNSDVYSDIAKILDIEQKNKEDGEFSDEQIKYMQKLHEETEIALQIILEAKCFDVGTYESESYGVWKRVE